MKYDWFKCEKCGCLLDDEDDCEFSDDDEYEDGDILWDIAYTCPKCGYQSWIEACTSDFETE